MSVPVGSPWSEERVETAKRMWRDGSSATEIAKALHCGVTRNSVISKLHRIGVARTVPIWDEETAAKKARDRNSAYCRDSRAHLSNAPRQPKAPRKIKPPAASIQRPLPEPIMVSSPPRAPSQGVVLAKLKHCQCRWPLGEITPGCGELLLFCAAPCGPAESYCAEHAAIAYQGGQSTRELTRSLRRYR